jgi:hypothetical protein
MNANLVAPSHEEPKAPADRSPHDADLRFDGVIHEVRRNLEGSNGYVSVPQTVEPVAISKVRPIVV